MDEYSRPVIKNLMSQPSSRLWAQRLATFNLYYALFIILWGAWVRLSGSGAGCGEHWPLCDGEVVPMAPSLAKLIEFTHRATTGVFGLTVLAQLFLSLKHYPKKHPARFSAVLILALTIVESLIGAFLVKKGLVADNQSLMRAWVIGLHLANTFFLLSALKAGEYFSRGDFLPRKSMTFSQKTFLGAGFFLLLLVGASGAIAALGNTLFPVDSLVEGVKADFDSSSHFLIQLRIIHPLLALSSSVFLFLGSWRLAEREELPFNLVKPFLWLLLFQVLFGIVNWILLAPAWGALVHLLGADLVWLSLTGLGLSFWPSQTFDQKNSL